MREPLAADSADDDTTHRRAEAQRFGELEILEVRAIEIDDADKADSDHERQAGHDGRP